MHFGVVISQFAAMMRFTAILREKALQEILLYFLENYLLWFEAVFKIPLFLSRQINQTSAGKPNGAR